jgi:hypothetical protein
VVGHAGAALLRELADRLGLTGALGWHGPGGRRRCHAVLSAVGGGRWLPGGLEVPPGGWGHEQHDDPDAGGQEQHHRDQVDREHLGGDHLPTRAPARPPTP